MIPSELILILSKVYVGKLGNAYMHECIIGGQTDFFCKSRPPQTYSHDQD